jgi:hypothetical protein
VQKRLCICLQVPPLTACGSLPVGLRKSSTIDTNRGSLWERFPDG